MQTEYRSISLSKSVFLQKSELKRWFFFSRFSSTNPISNQHSLSPLRQEIAPHIAVKTGTCLKFKLLIFSSNCDSLWTLSYYNHYNTLGHDCQDISLKMSIGVCNKYTINMLKSIVYFMHYVNKFEKYLSFYFTWWYPEDHIKTWFYHQGVICNFPK